MSWVATPQGGATVDLASQINFAHSLAYKGMENIPNSDYFNNWGIGIREGKRVVAALRSSPREFYFTTGKF